jgi:LIM homeobox protein 3/4
VPKCTVCQDAIVDKFVLKVDENLFFHMKCLKCSSCDVKLNERCYHRDGRVYCREDFFKKFGTKCSSCFMGIAPDEPVRRTASTMMMPHSNDDIPLVCVYHLKCFRCKMCQMELQTGDEFYLMDDKKLFCKSDYEIAKAKGKSKKLVISRLTSKKTKQNFI